MASHLLLAQQIFSEIYKQANFDAGTGMGIGAPTDIQCIKVNGTFVPNINATSNVIREISSKRHPQGAGGNKITYGRLHTDLRLVWLTPLPPTGENFVQKRIFSFFFSQATKFLVTCTFNTSYIVTP